MSDALTIVVSVLAAQQIRAAEEWWRVNRPKAPTALQEDLDRASSLIAIQPELGARARNVALPDVSPDGKHVVMFPVAAQGTAPGNLRVTFLLNLADELQRRFAAAGN